MNDRFYRMMTSHYKELDPKIYYLAELLFYPYIEKDYYGELLRRNGFSISLSRCMNDDDRNLEIVEALILDNAFERAIIEIYSYNGGYQESDCTSWHIALDSEIMNSHEYDEIYKKISKKDENKALFYKIDYNNAIDLIQKYNKIWQQDLNDKAGDYFQSSVQISKVIQEIYRQYELYGSRSFILKNSDFPNIELANTLLFICLDIGIIEIDFNYQFFRDDKDRLPDEYKIKVTKDIRSTNIYPEIIKCTFNSNPTLFLFLEQITNLENLAQKRLLKEEKVIDLENNLKIHDFSYIQDDIFQAELEVLKSRTKPTVFRGRVVPGQPTIQCLGDIGLILNEWKRILTDYQKKYLSVELLNGEKILETKDSDLLIVEESIYNSGYKILFSKHEKKFKKSNLESDFSKEVFFVFLIDKCVESSDGKFNIIFEWDKYPILKNEYKKGKMKGRNRGENWGSMQEFIESKTKNIRQKVIRDLGLKQTDNHRFIVFKNDVLSIDTSHIEATA